MGYLHMLLSATSFAAMAAVSKSIGPRASTLEKIFWRSAISISLTLAVEMRQGRPLVSRPRNPWLLLLRGICGLIALMAYLESVERLPLAEATFLGKIHPFAAAVFARAFLGEAIGW